MAIEIIRALIQLENAKLFEEAGILISDTEGPLSLERFSNYIIFECILRGWGVRFESKAMHAHMSDQNGGQFTESDRMRHNRTIWKLESYREIERINQETRWGIELPELRKPEFKTTPAKKREGRALSALNFAEIVTHGQVAILEHMERKSVCDNKHFSNARLSDELKEYYDYFDQCFSKAETAEERVRAAVNFFNVEDHYSIEFLWALAVEISRRQIEDIPFQEIQMLCGRKVLANGIKTDSRFVLERLELIPLLFDKKQWYDQYHDRVYYLLSTKAQLFLNSKFSGTSLVEFFQDNTTTDEWADFISNHYPIRNLLHEKIVVRETAAVFRKLVDGIIAGVPKEK